MKSYCLTVQVQSEHIENGLGYMIAFQLQDDRLNPDQDPEFAVWSERIRQAVLRTGDQPFDPDTYTRKVAIAELMHELDAINRSSGIQIVSGGLIPAVRIRSTNPYDKKINIDFTSDEGTFCVTEYGLEDQARSRVREHGKTGVVAAGTERFPFEQDPPSRRPPFSPRF